MRKASQKTNGPVEVIKGKSISIPIYLTPAFGRNSWTISYYVDKKRVRERAGTLEDAREQAWAAIERLSSGAALITTLTPKQSLMLSEVTEALKPSGLRLSDVVREYLEAKDILNGHGSLVDAARHFVKHQGETKIPVKAFDKIVEEFHEHLVTVGLSDLYQRDCRIRLARAAKAFGSTPIANIRKDEVNAWLTSGKRSPRTVNNDRRMLVTLFNFARDAGYLPEDGATQAEKSTKRKEISGRTTILTPKNFAKLLSETPAKFLPLVAIGGLAGVRTAEIFRLDWADVSLQAGIITIHADSAKTASRRTVPIVPALKSWLKSSAKKSGPIWEYKNLQGFLNAWSKAKSGLSVNIPTNALRHSFGSYRLATVKDAAKVSFEMGNSPRKLYSNYNELVTEAEGKKWFAVSKPS